MNKAERQEMDALREITSGQQNRITQLEKEVASNKGTYEWINRQLNEAKGELEQLHIFLDALPGAAPREGELVGYEKPKLSAMTRLAVFLAGRQKVAAKEP
jgi:hypothetical protein